MSASACPARTLSEKRRPLAKVKLRPSLLQPSPVMTRNRLMNERGAGCHGFVPTVERVPAKLRSYAGLIYSKEVIAISHALLHLPGRSKRAKRGQFLCTNT